MFERPVGELPESLAVRSLADLRVSNETLDSIVGLVGRLGLEALEGWDAVGTTLVEGDKVATYGCTDESVAVIDQHQYDSGAGPCVDALDGKIYYFDGALDEPRWRRFAEAAADLSIYSVASFPLMAGDRVLGGMNFYSKERDALRDGQREEGQVFAGQAAVAIANVRDFSALGDQVEQLEEGLRTRTIIGQATGLLMAQEGLSSEEAFQRLVHVSQNANLKLRDIAQRYVETWEGKVRSGVSR